MSQMIDAAVKALGAKLSGGFDGVAKFVIPGEGAIMLDATGVRAGDELVGVVAMERIAEHALLRSLAVAPSRRGAGAARRLRIAWLAASRGASGNSNRSSVSPA